MFIKSTGDIPNHEKLIVIGYEDSMLVRDVLLPVYDKFEADTILYLRDDNDLNKVLSTIRYKPFFQDKWLVSYSYDVKNQSSKKIVEKLLAVDSKNCSIVIYIPNSTYRGKFSRDKYIKGVEVGVVNLSYLPRRFYKALIFKKLTKHITNDGLSLFLKYMSGDYRNILYYISLLNSISETQVTSSEIKVYVPDTRKYDIRDFITSIISNKSEKQSIKILSDILTRYKIKTIMNGVGDVLDAYISIKELMYDGQITYITAYEDIQRLKKRRALPIEIEKKSTKYIRESVKVLTPTPMKMLVLLKILFLNIPKDEMSLIHLTIFLCNRNKWDADDVQYLQSILTREEVS